MLAALAEEVTVHADDYYAAEHFIPSGAFQLGESTPGWTPSAHTLFAGEVIEAETPANTVTGTAFHRIRVRTIATIELDVAIATTDVEQPLAPGNVVTGTFFMTGRLGLQAPDPAEAAPKRRRWFRR